jgi:hypothetical protein|tara:strand:+ start:556 stop:828 length:273 start_codon:yes stop_codon:yes gene_type:complete
MADARGVPPEVASSAHPDLAFSAKPPFDAESPRGVASAESSGEALAAAWEVVAAESGGGSGGGGSGGGGERGWAGMGGDESCGGGGGGEH